MTKIADQGPKTTYIWTILFVLVIFVYFFGLDIPLVGPDEPRYAQVAREMFERGDWITPTLGGFNWFEKPALLYWVQIASYNLFGVSEFSARFGSALFGLGTILSLWILGRFAVTQNTEINLALENSHAHPVNSAANDFANWLALIAASSIGIIVFSRGASFDIILTFPMTAALVSFFIFDSIGERSFTVSESGHRASTRRLATLSLIAFYFFIGVAVLAKGLIGMVFPFAIVAFYFLLSWRLPNRTFILSLFWGTLLAIGVASLWYLPMYRRHGYEFIDEFFIQHHFQRFTSNKYFHPQPFYFFFWVLPLMTIPWLPFFFAALWGLGKQVIQRRDAETQSYFKKLELSNIVAEAPPGLSVSASPRVHVSSSPLFLFSLAWLLVPLVFFSFSGSKLPGYILPAIPPAIILTAELIWRFVQKDSKRAVWVQAAAISTFIAVVAVLLFIVPEFAKTDSVKGLLTAAGARGFSSERVLALHTISHNAEFYAAGRLLRTHDGKQRKFLGPAEVLEQIKLEEGESVLVIVPLEYLRQLMESDLVNTEIVNENGELAIVHASPK